MSAPIFFWGGGWQGYSRSVINEKFWGSGAALGYERFLDYLPPGSLKKLLIHQKRGLCPRPPITLLWYWVYQRYKIERFLIRAVVKRGANITL